MPVVTRVSRPQVLWHGAVHNSTTYAAHTLSKMVGQTVSKRYHVTVWATSLDSVFTFVGQNRFIEQRLASIWPNKFVCCKQHFI